MKDNRLRRFLTPQSCEECPDAPAGPGCYRRFNCPLYAGTISVSVDKVAETAAAYSGGIGEWEKDVEALKRLMGV